MRDLEAHRIPARLQRVANFISNSHYHTWMWNTDNGPYTFFECIDRENDWNSLAAKTAFVALCAVGVTVMPVIPVYKTGKMVVDISSHASQVEKDLAWVADEIEKIYHHTNALILANLI